MDEHKWTDEGLAFRAKPAGIYPAQPVSADPMTLMRRVAREVLRLAGEVEELNRAREDDADVRSVLFAAGQQAAAREEATARDNALLRRERALLIELEKARTRILASIFDTGGGCSAEDVRQVGELMMSIEAIHLEASGGVQRPEGVACACVLCRPGGIANALPAFRCEGCGAWLAADQVVEIEAGLCHTREARDEKGVPFPDCCGPVRPARAHTGAPGNTRAIRDDDHSSR